MTTKGERVDGVIFGRVKGGFTVDLGGAVAFLPGSQVDVRPIRDVGPLMHVAQPFQILKMDRRRGNIVVSRRAIMEETRAEQRSELVQNLAEGQVVDGVVKNITDYGAFVDLGGIDGLLHVTDIAWKRVNHPSDVLTVGQTVKVQIVRINPETQRISLGMKQLDKDPWDIVIERYTVGTKVKGKVTNITDYGAFVELEDGIEGLVHVSEMSWTKKNVHPGKILSTSEEVDVQVLEIDAAQAPHLAGPQAGAEQPMGRLLSQPSEGFHRRRRSQEHDRIRSVRRPRWRRRRHGPSCPTSTGSVPAKKPSRTTRRATWSRLWCSMWTVKRNASPWASSSSRAIRSSLAGPMKKGDKVTCEVMKVEDGGLEVQIAGTDLTAYAKRGDLARDRGEQRPERFAVGEKFDAIITLFDAKARKVNVSIKALEISDEREAVATYGSSDSGASLGDILQAALKKKGEENE